MKARDKQAKSTVQEISSSPSGYRRMSTAQCEKIHWASLELLERYGVKLHDQEAIDLLKKGEWKENPKSPVTNN